MSKDILQRKRILTKASSGSSISTPVSVANGGIGLNSYTVGDLIYASGATTLSKLPIGTANQQLRVNAGATALEYFTPAASGITINSTAITSGADNRILFQDATGGDFVTQAANFTMGAVATGFLDVPAGYAINGNIFARNSIVNTSLSIGNNAANPATAIGNTCIGMSAGANILNVANTAVGDRALTSGAQAYNSALGYRALGNTTASRNIGIGGLAGFNITSASYSIIIGTENFGGNFSSSISIGTHDASANTLTADHQGVLGTNYVNGYISDWYFNGVTHSSAYSVVLNASGGSGTNNAGANITIAGGKGTGTAAGGNVKDQTSVPVASGATAQTLGDRNVIIAKYIDVTETTETGFASLGVPSGTVCGGDVVITIEANDGTDYQCRTLTTTWSAINKAGTITTNLATPLESIITSDGTLTATLTFTDSGSNVALFNINATSSLTQSVLRVNAQFRKNMGTGSINGI